MDEQTLLATFQKGVQEIKLRGYTEGEISQSLGLTPTYFSAVKHGKYPLTKEVYNKLVDIYKDIEHLPKKQKQPKVKNTPPHRKIVDALPFQQIDSPQAQRSYEERDLPSPQSTAIVPIVRNWQERWPIGVPVPDHERALFLQSTAHLSAFEQSQALSERVPQGHYDPSTGITTVSRHEYSIPREYYYTDDAQSDIAITISQVKTPLPQIRESYDDIEIDEIEKVEIDNTAEEDISIPNSPSLFRFAGKAAWLGVKGLFQVADRIVSSKPVPYEMTEEYLREQEYAQEQARLEEQEQERMRRQQKAEEAEDIRAKLEEMLQRRQKRYQS